MGAIIAKSEYIANIFFALKVHSKVPPIQNGPAVTLFVEPNWEN
jgi:hypothetical protein